MQRIELSTDESSVHCIFCGHEVVRGSDSEEPLSPCEDTLFIATDYGFEYRSDKFNELKNIPDNFDDLDVPEEGMDEFTGSVELRDSYKVAMYTPAPSFLGAYVGFWSGDE